MLDWIETREARSWQPRRKCVGGKRTSINSSSSWSEEKDPCFPCCSVSMLLNAFYTNRMEGSLWPKKIYQWTPHGRRWRATPKQSWKNHVMDHENQEHGRIHGRGYILLAFGSGRRGLGWIGPNKKCILTKYRPTSLFPPVPDKIVSKNIVPSFIKFACIQMGQQYKAMIKKRYFIL